MFKLHSPPTTKIKSAGFISKLTRKTGVKEMSRNISPTNHIVSMMYGQTANYISLNDVCDSLGGRGRYVLI